jgi:hypothetical protein
MKCKHCGEDICDTCWQKRADILYRSAALEGALRGLADAAETFAGSEPDMPSHEDTEREFDAALAAARAALAEPVGGGS